MMLGVLQSNADNVLASITRLRHSFDILESALQNGKIDKLEATLDQSRNHYQTLIN
jgi:prephenate dehydrogenase